MTSTSGTGHFMLTLCRLAAPVAIRPPPRAQLKPFTFFMSRVRQPDGSEQLYLNMGYFETLADAERRLEAVRRHYPDAFATTAPVELAPVKDESSTDTQVLRILEAGSVSDDTITRQALKEAVAQGAPVSFAVQLHWSEQPIDLSRVPSLAIFQAYSLYATESRREGRCRHFLRLGFFAEPISAKLVAVQVRSTFAAAAVVPVVEPEVTRAREACMGSSAIPYLSDQRVDQGVDPNARPTSPTQSKPVTDASRTDPDSLSESGVRHLRVEVQEHSSGRWRVVRLRARASNMG